MSARYSRQHYDAGLTGKDLENYLARPEGGILGGLFLRRKLGGDQECAELSELPN